MRPGGLTTPSRIAITPSSTATRRTRTSAFGAGIFGTAWADGVPPRTAGATGVSSAMIGKLPSGARSIWAHGFCSRAASITTVAGHV